MTAQPHYLILHLIAFVALLGTSSWSAASRTPRAFPVFVGAAAVQIATGVALVVASVAGDETPNGPKLAMKSVVLAGVIALGFAARRRPSRARGLFTVAAVRAAADALIALSWD